MFFNLFRPPFVVFFFKLCRSFFALVVLVCLKLFLGVFTLFLSPLVVSRFRSVLVVEVLVCSCGCLKCLRCVTLLSDVSGLFVVVWNVQIVQVVPVVLGRPGCSISCFSVALGCLRLFQDVSDFV